MITAGIVGGTGYTGVELIRILSAHPQVNIRYITSRRLAGTKVSDVFPSLYGQTDLSYTDLSIDRLSECDVVFFATPHGVAMHNSAALLDNQTKVIDLAADFRLQSVEAFEKWYKMSHSETQLLSEAVYGLTELNRTQIQQARLIGNPGCYPTTVILGIAPIIQHSLTDSLIVADAKSGVSGAGKRADEAFGYAEVADNFKAYGVSGHRHQAEIDQAVMQLHQHLDKNLSSGTDREQSTLPQVKFVPHLVPMIRGMLTTLHIQLNQQGKQSNLHEIYQQTYADDAFIDVLPKQQFPETRSTRASNRLKIGIEQDMASGLATVIVAQDNLVKGAAGQAVQNMNLMFGLDETTGLTHIAVSP